MSSSCPDTGATPTRADAVIPPPPRVSNPRNTLWQDLRQGLEYVKFVWNISRRIRGFRNRLRFVIGLILWKPILPQEHLD